MTTSVQTGRTVSTGRVLGIRARVKQTKDQEARPTQVFVLTPKSKAQTFNLKTDGEELAFIAGQYPTKWRTAEPGEDLSNVPAWHIAVKGDVTQVATEFDGLQPGDTVVMGLGFGDELAYSLARRGAAMPQPATVQRVPPIILSEYRKDFFEQLQEPEANVKPAKIVKDNDAQLLTELWAQSPELFYQVRQRDKTIIQLRIKFKQWEEAQKARIACEQRLIKRLRTEMYLSPELYPEGNLEDMFLAQKANDLILQGLVREESKRKREMEKILDTLDVYTEIFQPVEGVGPSLAIRLIAGIQDIRRFSTKHQLKAYCGVHLRRGGKFADVPPEKQFPRRRGGETANWNDACRKSLYLFIDQCNKRANSVWGKKFRLNKERWAERHPDASKMHVQRTAGWRTATQFAEFLWERWTRLEAKALAQARANGS